MINKVSHVAFSQEKREKCCKKGKTFRTFSYKKKIQFFHFQHFHPTEKKRHGHLEKTGEKLLFFSTPI
jgi:hypothetical protein